MISPRDKCIYSCKHLSCEKPVGSQWRKMKMNGADLAKTLNSSILFISMTEGGHILETRRSEMLKGFVIILKSTGN